MANYTITLTSSLPLQRALVRIDGVVDGAAYHEKKDEAGARDHESREHLPRSNRHQGSHTAENASEFDKRKALPSQRGGALMTKQ